MTFSLSPPLQCFSFRLFLLCSCLSFKLSFTCVYSSVKNLLFHLSFMSLLSSSPVSFFIKHACFWKIKGTSLFICFSSFSTFLFSSLSSPTSLVLSPLWPLVSLSLQCQAGRQYAWIMEERQRIMQFFFFLFLTFPPPFFIFETYKNLLHCIKLNSVYKQVCNCLSPIISGVHEKLLITTFRSSRLIQNTYFSKMSTHT